MRLWDVFSAVHGFLYHPNVWIRQGAAGFVAKAASQLPPSDIWCIIYPTIRPALRSDIVTLDEDSILSALVAPVCGYLAMALTPAAIARNIADCESRRTAEFAFWILERLAYALIRQSSTYKGSD